MTMKLVEVIKGELTSDDTLQATLRIIEVLRKHPVVLPETPGFVVNRLLFPMINEAVFLLSEGVADAKTIDSCMRMGANHPMGPLELADMIGLDVCLSIFETLVDETGDGKYRPAPLLKKFVRAGKLGKKTGCGFYNYKRN
jgi:3-hydroxybutyryl-CoA dehydrogenase